MDNTTKTRRTDPHLDPIEAARSGLGQTREERLRSLALSAVRELEEANHKVGYAATTRPDAAAVLAYVQAAGLPDADAEELDEALAQLRRRGKVWGGASADGVVRYMVTSTRR